MTSDEKQEQARGMVLSDIKMIITGNATQSDIGQGSVHTIVHDILGCHIVYVRWAP
jgi:hypothetical protein